MRVGNVVVGFRSVVPMTRIPRYYFPWDGGGAIESDIIQDEAARVVHAATARVDESNTNKSTLLLKLREEIYNVDLPYRDVPNTVFADGNPDSPIMVIGEGPGEQEVLQGKPFVGRSGKLLEEMMNAAGILRQNIYITNAVVWRPPNNRTPLPEEVDSMRPYVHKHIAIIEPKILILVGGVSYRCVMGESLAISKVRGIWHVRDFCKNVINIFHPSYLLRSPIHRQETWHDLLDIRKKVSDLGFSEYLTGGVLYSEKSTKVNT